MKKSRFTETQIVAMLQQYDSGMKVTDIRRDKGITTATFYRVEKIMAKVLLLSFSITLVQR